MTPPTSPDNYPAPHRRTSSPTAPSGDRSDAEASVKFPLPGRHPRVASLALWAIHLRVAPKGSGEEFGRQPAMTVNKKTFSNVASCVQPVQRSDMLYFISSFRPHSSSVMESVPKSRFHDSFPPGEAILGAPAPIRKTAPSEDRAVMWFCAIKASRRIAKTTDLAVRCNSSTNWNLSLNSYQYSPTWRTVRT